MVLKRLFVTALSALGLSALTAGPATAQQIPAPDAYGNAQACSSAFPTAMAEMAPKEHALQDSLDAGALTTADSNALAKEAAPCDVNGAAAGFGDDIADGFNLARELYDKAAEAQAGVDAAQKVYDDDDSASNLADLNEAKAKLKVAADARDLYAGVMADGTGGMYVYDNVYKEEAELAAAQKAITAWTTAVTDASASQTEVNNVEYGEFVTQFAGFDANGEARAFAYYEVPDDATLSDGSAIDDGTIYVQIKGADGKIIAPAMGTGGTFVLPEALDGDNTDDDPVVYVSHTDTFEADGSNFQGGTTAGFQIRTIDLDGDTSTTDDVVNLVALNNSSADAVLNSDLRFGQDGSDTEADGIDDIYKAAKDAYDDAKDAAENNVNKDVQTRLDERERKAKARYDFYKDQKDEAYKQLAAGALEVQGDNARTIGTTETEYDFTTAYYRAYNTAQGAKDDAGDDLKDAYDDVVAANKAVQDSLKDTGDYLNQLVALRQYEKNEADEAAKAADPDATEKTAGQKTADAALKTAQAQLKTYNDLQDLGDEHPVKELVNSLLVANGEDGDDDGQALADAISSTYDTAKDAKDTADGVASDVAGLTGEGGAVAMNTAAIEKNAGDITALDGRVTQNEADILTNAGNIMTNAENIASNTMMIGENRGMIETNTGNIAANSGRIDANETAIGANTSAIADNANAIGSNSAAIQRNSGMIGELSESLEVVRAGVAASMALAGMPAINGRGISIGVGSFDGESAFAVGFMIQSEMASFKVGVTSAGGATGASAGVGFQF